MKQYNEDVYIISPIVLENLLRRPPVNPDDLLEAVKSQSIKGSIVLSPEELRELWKAGAQHGYESDFGGPAPDLETYLQSKGLTIKQQ